MSRVDVVIPCYNYGRFLEKCLESALTQDGVDVRVLIVDDASPDDTPTVAAELAKKDHRIEYRRHGKNLGHIASYNEGLDWAQGDYLSLLSADDLLPPGVFRRAAELMDAHPEVGLTFGETVSFTDGDPLPALPTDGQPAPPRILKGVEFIERICAGHFPMPVSVVVRTSLQKRIGGWRSDLPHAGDPEMWLRFAHSDVGMLSTCQGYYRRHRTNMSTAYRRSPLSDWRENNEAYNIFFRQYGDTVPDVERLKQFRHKMAAEFGLLKATQAFERGQVEEARVLFDAVLEFESAVTSWKTYQRLKWKLKLGFWGWSIVRTALTILRSLRR